MNDMHHPLNALPQGHRLQEYELVRVLGFGGFGMTYLGYDHNLDKAVAIKEYLPSDIATRTGDNSVAPQASQFRDDFEWGLDRFLDEARTLARFDHPHIVKVHRFFQAHGTAFIVMEYAEGETLSAFLERKRTLSEEELKAILYPILNGLEVVHRAEFLHRDIKPGNIIIRDEDDSPVLLDFGAARQAIGTKSRSITSIITPGYAPIEQYERSGHQGPWTDIYALGVVCYHALTGQVPNDATERMRRDSLLPVSERCAGQASAGFLSAIDTALQVNEEDRPQSIAEWRVALGEEKPPSPPPEKSKGKLFAAVACIIALLIGGGYYYQYEYIPNQRRQTQVEAEAVVARETERLRQSKITKYEGKFEEALGDRDYYKADRYMDSLRVVNADGAMLSRLAGRLSEEQETEQRRLEEEQRVGRRFKDCAECPEMVVVPSGSFTMGSPKNKVSFNNEGPSHRVNIDYPLAVGLYEVKFSEWDTCVADGGCEGYIPDDEGWGRQNRPVINVSWEDAQSYVRWLSQKTEQSYRLLSESEWEYVARAGTGTWYSWGNEIGRNLANCDSCGSRWDGKKTAPVGSFSGNVWSIHEMHGNVREWVQDCYNDRYEDAPSDGSAWESENCAKFVSRGGSWASDPRGLRSANRSRFRSGRRNELTGFRVARRF